jgi:uncharacterized protein (DUF58 family)
MQAEIAEPLLAPGFLNRLAQLELVSRKVFRGRLKGERRSPRKGQSVEFADFRSYVVGDDLRFVDWNSYARLERLFLKLFLEEEDLHFYCLLDASPSMQFGEPSKLRFARQLAAALSFIGLVRSDRVKIETLGQPARRPGPVWRGRASVWRLLEHLESLPVDPPVPLVQGVRHFCLRNPGRGIVVLISDLMDRGGYEEAFRLLVARQVDAYVIHVLSPQELDPRLAGDLRLVDCEDSEECEITINPPVLKRYQATLAHFVNGAREFCTRRGLVYLLADTRVGVEQLVLSYLRKRGLVR